MSSAADSGGRIYTFFSYKGGVGRTMALSNAGFIAAMGGLRVLLMDWDLEAPGLSYYFRGLTGHAEANEIRKSEGVLDLFWRWVRGVDAAGSPEALDRHVATFASGEIFAKCAQPLVPRRRLPKGAALDVIGAGAPIINAPDPIPYADALSRFNWFEFFEQSAGGLLIESIRDWSKENYDLVLVDSRTGLADIAGICTMQLPDAAILCFVLNRQNMEGVAQVASAIRRTRGDDVDVRVAPMRVSRERPTEEADARARAEREFRRAGLKPDQLSSDMERLSIPAAPNVPFYETLAPFAAVDPSLDLLTLAYQGFVQEMIGRELARPKIDAAWRDDVRRRLEPRLTTLEYLETLETAEPSRAKEEVERFLTGAFDADPSLELEPDYVAALVKAAFGIQDLDWDGEDDGSDARRLATRAVDLLHHLNASGAGDWRIQLVNALQEFQFYFRATTSDDLRENYLTWDSILSEGEQSFEILHRRLYLHLAIARNLVASEHLTDVLKEGQAAEDLLARATIVAENEQLGMLALAEGEIALLRSSALAKKDPNESRHQAQTALNSLLRAPASPARSRVASEAHFRLATLLPKESADATAHVLAAVREYPRNSVSRAKRFEEMAEIVLGGAEAGEHAADLVLAAFGDRSRRTPSGVVGLTRNLEDSISFARTATKLTQAINERHPGDGTAALIALAEVASQAVARLSRRPHAMRSSPKGGYSKFIARYVALSEALASAGVPAATLKRLSALLAGLDASGPGDTSE